MLKWSWVSISISISISLFFFFPLIFLHSEFSILENIVRARMNRPAPTHYITIRTAPIFVFAFCEENNPIGPANHRATARAGPRGDHYSKHVCFTRPNDARPKTGNPPFPGLVQQKEKKTNQNQGYSYTLRNSCPRPHVLPVTSIRTVRTTIEVCRQNKQEKGTPNQTKTLQDS